MTTSPNYRISFPLPDGLSVETVYYGSGTLCISTQVGCAIRCPFCASGSQGLLRNLTLNEMIGQVIAVRETGRRPARITLSGIGEPLHNPDTVRDFMLWCRQRALPVSLTTTGSPLSRLAEFLPGPDNGLMLSLHSGTPCVHRQVIPHGPDYEALWGLLLAAWPRLSRRRRRKIGVNYLLLAGVNDSDTDIEALALRIKAFPEITLHLLTMNPVPGDLYASPGTWRVMQIHAALSNQGCNVRLANRWRRQSEGGCGTLTVGNSPLPAAPV